MALIELNDTEVCDAASALRSKADADEKTAKVLDSDATLGSAKSRSRLADTFREQAKRERALADKIEGSESERAICSRCDQSVALAGPRAVRKLVHHNDARGVHCEGE